ncbi:hypothetical protein FD755_003491, partial [Muntiacus reevesi]
HFVDEKIETQFPLRVSERYLIDKPSSSIITPGNKAKASERADLSRLLLRCGLTALVSDLRNLLMCACKFLIPIAEMLFRTVACTHLDVDLVCITVTEKLPFYFKRPPINVAIDRGVGFELLYSPAIKDSTMRRYTISNALNLMQVCKGKNVIISSAAERPLEIRGPYDVANLYPFLNKKGLLFGLSESDAKAAVSTNCRAVLLHGETRKTAFGIISTVKKPRTSEADDDSLPACKKAKCES